MGLGLGLGSGLGLGLGSGLGLGPGLGPGLGLGLGLGLGDFGGHHADSVLVAHAAEGPVEHAVELVEEPLLVELG